MDQEQIQEQEIKKVEVQMPDKSKKEYILAKDDQYMGDDGVQREHFSYRETPKPKSFFMSKLKKIL